jgi:membrane-associated phospholipid phosphatase
MKIAVGIASFDQNVSRVLITNCQNPLLLRAMRLVSRPFSGLFCLTAYLGIFFFAKMDVPLVPLLVAAECVQLSIIIPLRNLFKRARPRPAEKGEYFWRWNSYSFPSLHSSRAVMLAVVLFLLFGQTEIIVPSMMVMLAFAIPVTVGFSRLLLQKHYLSDVLCGAVIGGMAAVVVVFVY